MSILKAESRSHGGVEIPTKVTKGATDGIDDALVRVERTWVVNIVQASTLKRALPTPLVRLGDYKNPHQHFPSNIFPQLEKKKSSQSMPTIMLQLSSPLRRSADHQTKPSAS